MCAHSTLLYWSDRMKFDAQFPEVSAMVRFEPEPNPIKGVMEASGRVSPCVVCGSPTQWVGPGEPDLPPPHLCSDECVTVFG